MCKHGMSAGSDSIQTGLLDLEQFPVAAVSTICSYYILCVGLYLLLLIQLPDCCASF